MLVLLYVLACGAVAPAPATARAPKEPVVVEASSDLRLTSTADPEAVVARLLDLDRAIRCTPDKVAGRRLDASTIEVTSERTEAGVDFRGTATTRYARAGHVVTWQTAPGSNPAVRARVEVAAAPGGSTIRWRQTSTATLLSPPGRIAFVRAGAPGRLRHSQEAFASCVLPP